MLDENLNEEYINKLDGIIEFFKVEKEFDLHYIIIGEEDSKFRMTFNISIIVVLIATTNLISLVETFPEIFIQIMILFTLFLLLIIFTGDFM